MEIRLHDVGAVSVSGSCGWIQTKEICSVHWCFPDSRSKMVKQVVIQLQDFTSDVCDAPLPAEEQTSFGIKTGKQVRNGLKIE